MTQFTSDINLDELLEDIRHLIKSEQTNFVMSIIADLHPADISEIMSHLDEEERRAIFSLLPSHIATKVIVELEENVKEDVLEGLNSHQIANMVIEMDSDDAADLVSELPVEQASEVLDRIKDEESEEIQELLLYPEDTAGGIMAKEYVSVNVNSSVEEAISEIRDKHHEVEDLYHCFVVDDFNNLVGMVSLRDIILARPNTRIRDIMDEEITTVPSEMDQEEVAHLFKKYDIVVAPVVNRRNKLLGRITIDDVVDVIGEEIEEDLGRIGGTGEEEVLEDSVFQISRARLPWLVLSFIGQIFSAFIMVQFEAVIEQIIASTFFIPLVMAIGGSVGQQSSIIVVRGLSTGEIGLIDTGRRLRREFFVALFNGIILALLIFFTIYLWNKDYIFGAVLSMTLVIIIMNASIFGAVIPLFLKKINVDPALATGPFVATFNDVVGLIIYFTLITIGFNYLI